MAEDFFEVTHLLVGAIVDPVLTNKLLGPLTASGGGVVYIGR